MYIIANATLSPSKTVVYSSLAGQFANQPTHMGCEENSSLVRGYLLATLQGLQRLVDLFGISKRSLVDVLVADPKIADVLQKKEAISTVLHGDDDDLYTKLIEFKKVFEIRFVSNPLDSPHLAVIVNWSSTPPLGAEIPVEYNC